MFVALSKNSKIESRQTDGVPNGEISEDDFGKWTEFANCMKDVLSLIEGQAYRPETTEDIQIWGNGVLTYVDTNQKPMDREGNYADGDVILAGGMVRKFKYIYLAFSVYFLTPARRRNVKSYARGRRHA